LWAIVFDSKYVHIHTDGKVAAGERKGLKTVAVAAARINTNVSSVGDLIVTRVTKPRRKSGRGDGRRNGRKNGNESAAAKGTQSTWAARGRERGAVRRCRRAFTTSVPRRRVRVQCRGRLLSRPTSTGYYRRPGIIAVRVLSSRACRPADAAVMRPAADDRRRPRRVPTPDAGPPTRLGADLHRGHKYDLRSSSFEGSDRPSPWTG